MFTIRNSLQLIGIICFLNLIVLQILFQGLDQNTGKAEDMFFLLSEEKIGVGKFNQYSKRGYLKISVIYGPKSDFGDKPHPFLPSGVDETSDRIEEQLGFRLKNASNVKHKVILTLGVHTEQKLETMFIDRGCPVSQCKIITARTEKQRKKMFQFQNWTNIDAVLMRGFHKLPPKLPHQVYVISELESPMHFGFSSHMKNKINWTYTYRRDSTIVTPYFRFKASDDPVTTQKPRNYARGKSRLAAWFVSNCGSSSGRLGYVRELQKYIPVHIYGACGNYSCARTNTKCDKILDNKYKFYLSFENSLCKDYMTEKLHINALQRNVVPVVMGGTYKEYVLAAPPNSFIHVDKFKTPRDLAEYLLYLDKNDEEYNKYFRWKGSGTFMDTKTVCRLCAMLHADLPPVWYKDVSAWWSPGISCRKSNYSDQHAKPKTSQRRRKNRPNRINQRQKVIEKRKQLINSRKQSKNVKQNRKSRKQSKNTKQNKQI